MTGLDFPCECGADSTGEAPDERPWCPQHGVVRFLTPLLGKPYCQRHDETPRNCWELHLEPSQCAVADCTYSAAVGSGYCTLHGVKWDRKPPCDGQPVIPAKNDRLDLGRSR